MTQRVDFFLDALRPQADYFANLSVNTDRREAALLGSLRGFAAPAAGYLQR